MSDTKQKCEACGNENEGEYHKYHYGRWLKKGEDILIGQAYRWTIHCGGGSSPQTSEVLKTSPVTINLIYF